MPKLKLEIFKSSKLKFETFKNKPKAMQFSLTRRMRAEGETF
jgi:hypothetical protein